MDKCKTMSLFSISGVDIQETNDEYTLDIGDSSCGYPGSPRNGSVDSAVMLYRQGEEVTFTCQEGFVLFGPDKRTCRRNGTWSDTIPECSTYILFFIPIICNKIKVLKDFYLELHGSILFQRTKFSTRKIISSIFNSMELWTSSSSWFRSRYMLIHTSINWTKMVAGPSW